MNYRKIVFIIFICLMGKMISAQTKIDPKKMTYLLNPKPNSILYNDTLYRGSAEYKELFFRNGDPMLRKLFEKHQSNKIWGTVLTTVGSFATSFGIIAATSSGNSQTAGWITAGSGFASMILGTYLILEGQKNLATAVYLFNSRYNKTSMIIGVSGDRAGLAINF